MTSSQDRNFLFLGIIRPLDQELLDRIKWHIREINLSNEAKNECKINETLQKYWLRSEGCVFCSNFKGYKLNSSFRRNVPIRDTWEQFYSEIGTCDLYRNDETLDKLLKDLSTMPI